MSVSHTEHTQTNEYIGFFFSKIMFHKEYREWRKPHIQYLRTPKNKTTEMNYKHIKRTHKSSSWEKITGQYLPFVEELKFLTKTQFIPKITMRVLRCRSCEESFYLDELSHRGHISCSIIANPYLAYRKLNGNW